MKVIRILIYSFFFLISVSSAANATALGDLAAKMTPGSWAKLETIGFDSGKILYTTGDYPGNISTSSRIIDYVESAAWDPNTRQFFHMSAPHNNAWKFIIYKDDTNTWETGPLPAECMKYGRFAVDKTSCGGHAFDLMTIDVSRGELIWRYATVSPRTFKYNIASKTWSLLPQVADKDLSSWTASYNKYGAMVYFPERNGIFSNVGKVMFFFHFDTGSWEKLPGVSPVGGYENFAEYNPVHKVIIFGGGNDGTNIHHELYKMDAIGKVTRLKDAPIPLRITGGPSSVGTLVTVDPVSGKYLILTSEKKLFEYDVIADSWKLMPTAAPITSNAVATPVNTYGVVMFVAAKAVYIYKHGECSSCKIPTPPVKPAGLKFD